MKTKTAHLYRKTVFLLLSILLSFLFSPFALAVTADPYQYKDYNTFVLKAKVSHDKTKCTDKQNAPHIWLGTAGIFSSLNDTDFSCNPDNAIYEPFGTQDSLSFELPLHVCFRYMPELVFNPLDYFLILTLYKNASLADENQNNIDLNDPLNPSNGLAIWTYPNLNRNQYSYKIRLHEMLMHGLRARYGCETIEVSLETRCPFSVENKGIKYVGYPYSYVVNASADCKEQDDYTYTPHIFMWEYAHAETNGFLPDTATGPSRVINSSTFPDFPIGKNLLVKVSDGRAPSSLNTQTLYFYPDIPQPTYTMVQKIPEGELYLRNITLHFNRNLRMDLEELTVITLYKKVAVSSDGIFNPSESQVITQHTVNMALMNGTRNYSFPVPPYTVTEGTYYVTVEGKVKGKSNNPALPENDTLPAAIKAAMFQCVPITVKSNEIPIEDIDFTPPSCYGGNGKVKITVGGFFLPFVSNKPDFYYKAADGTYVSIPFTCTYTGTQKDPHATFECGDIDATKTELKLVVRSMISSGGSMITEKKGATDDQISYVHIDFTQPDPLQVPIFRKDISGYYYENNVRKAAMDGRIVIQRSKASGGKKPYAFYYEQYNNTILGKVSLETDTLKVAFPSLFYFYLEDRAGCSFDTSISVNNLGKTLWVSLSIERQISCHNAQDGILRANVQKSTGGRLRYSWYKNNVLIAGASGASIDHIGPGKYKVVLTDPMLELSSSDEITLSEPEPLALDIQKIEHIDCFGQHTGGIELEGSGGVAPYLYSWDDGAFGKTRHEMPAGSYPVKLIDNNSCYITRTFTLNQPEEPFEIVIDTVIHAYHDADNNYVPGCILTHAQGGTSPYFPLFSTGNHNLNRLDSGTYELFRRDAKMCEDRKTVKVETYDRMRVDIVAEQQNLCFGDSMAVCRVRITGGVPPFLILWSTGSREEKIENLSDGTYAVTVTDAAGIVRLSQITLTAPPPLEITAEEIRQPSYGGCIDNNCPDAENDGRILVSVKGGSGTYQFDWTKDGQTFLSATDDASVIENLGNGYYTLHVSDAHACVAETGFVLEKIAPLKAEIEAEKTPGCFGSTDGVLQGKISGGTLPYRLTWEGISDTLSRLENLQAGMYVLTATDALGIQSRHTFHLTEPEPLRITTDQMQQASYPGSEDGIVSPIKADGRIHVSVSGGTPPYRYRWSGADYKDSIGEEAGIDSLLPGSFRLFLTDHAGCMTDTMFVLPYVAPLIGTISVEKPISCFGMSDAVLGADITGGTPPYTLQWYKDGDSLGNRIKLMNAGYGNYRLVVSDSLQVHASYSFLLEQPDSLTLRLFPLAGLCHGDSLGKAVAEVRGGTFPYTYDWYLDSELLPCKDSLLTHLETATIGLSVTDRRGCATSDSTSVTAPTALQVAHTLMPPSYTGSLWKSEPQPVNDGEIRLYAAGGTPPYRYEWLNGDTNSLITQADSGFYQVNVWDRNDCETSLSFYLKRTPELIAHLDLLAEPLCFDEATAKFSLSVQGGKKPYTYDWYRNGKWIGEDSVLPAEEMRAGLYQITVRDANGIISRDSLRVRQPEPLSASAHIRDASAWQFKNGEIRVEIKGGVPPYNLMWNNGDSGYLLTDIGRGTYSLEVTDAHLCHFNHTYTVNSPDSLHIASMAVQHTTENKSDGAIHLNVQGGMPPYFFRWEDAIGKILQKDSARQGSFAIENISEGIYRFHLTDAGGASLDRLVEVRLLQQLEVSLLIEKEIACHGQNASVQIWIQGGKPPYACVLETPDSVQTFMLYNEKAMRMENFAAGNYRISVRDAENTTRSATLFIPQPDPLVVTADIENSEDTASDGSFVLRVQGGRPPYRYFWNTGNVCERQDFVRNRSYWAEVRDGGECSVFIALDSVISEKLRISLTQISDIHCHGEATAALKVEIQNGKPPFRIRWSNNDTTTEIRKLPAGEYWVNVEDANGKTDSAIWPIREPDVLKNHISTQNPSCYGMHDGSIQLRTTGGSGYFIYTWNTGHYTDNLTDLPQGTYSVRTSDRMQCNIIDTIVLSEPARLESDLHVMPILCPDETGRIEWFGQGGTQPYIYHWAGEKEQGQSPIIDPAFAGNYRLSLRDSNHCRFDTSLSLSNPHILQYSWEKEKALCIGQSILLKAEGLDTIPDLEYLWVFPDGSVSDQAQPRTQMAGLHKLTLVQNHRCIYRDSVWVTASEDSIHAEFWVSSQITAKQSCLLVNLSAFQPDSIVWHIPETAEIVEKDGNYLELRFPEAGSHTVGMTSFKGFCSESIFRQIQVYDAILKHNGDEENLPVRWKVSPNPSLSTCSLTGESDHPLKVRYRLVRASTGQIIEQGKFDIPEGGRINRPILNGNVPAGIYILLIEYGLENRNFKLIRL